MGVFSALQSAGAAGIGLAGNAVIGGTAAAITKVGKDFIENFNKKGKKKERKESGNREKQEINDGTEENDESSDENKSDKNCD